jgi:putative heme-binding domain-containing protein
MHGPQPGEILLANWSSYTPTLRSQVLDALFVRDDLLPQLISAIRSGDIKPGQIDASRRQRLLGHTNEDIQSAASAAFAGTIDANRQKVIESYAGADPLNGNPAHGRELFGKHCSSCHHLENQGSAVGPDLAALTTRTTASLLEAVFDPNRSIDERYHSYLAVTDEGQTYTGILENETSTSITLVEQQGKKHTLLRNKLDELQNSGISLMPVGYEKDLSVADVADLFSYLMAQGRTK